ncbi:MAG: TonB-dependent receptor [Phaeodactylibacter sp.]|nr:TonB-dependent receptor [Phaeodactylibacter sp.]MCB9263697.1 TonB-dependent receptor [Lewinellaceae bacterium]MCB9286896.1 TonB-dependent receptor [Lewinellaceae bacterium]
MKRLYLLLAVFLAAVNIRAQGVLEQPVTIVGKGMLLEEALYQLADQENINLSFSNDILPDRRMDVEIRDENLAQALDYLLRGTGLEYRQLGTQVVIFPSAGQLYTISGFLEDLRTGERLISANIQELYSGKGAVSNEYGFYSLTLPAGKVSLNYSYLGYGAENRQFSLQADRKLDIALAPSLTLDPVEVVGERLEGGQSLVSYPSGHELNIRQVERLPALAGEADIIRVAHLLPGVQTGPDGVGGLHIRGGNNGQNLIMIDGVPVYNISHAAGIFSIFNTQAISSARLIKGGFPARYGGRLSSVLDIRTREGNRRAFGMKADLGLLSGRLTVEGPLVREKSSFFISGRWSFIDWFLEPLTQSLKADKGEDGFIGYRFHDLNAKLNYSLSPKDHIYLSYYSGADHYSNSGNSADTLEVRNDNLPEPAFFRFEKDYSDRISWGNSVASLRWNHLFSDKLFANLAATYSSLRVNIDYFASDSLIALSGMNTVDRLLDIGEYSSNIADLGLRLDFDFIPVPKHYIRFGANITHHRFLPGVFAYNVVEKSGNGEVLPQENKESNAVDALEYSAYFEDEARLSPRLRLNMGVHLAAFQVKEKTYWSPQPRFSLAWEARPGWELETYLSRMQQFVHLLSNSALGLPTEVWVPSTRNVAPQEGWQFGLGSTWNLKKGWEFSLEAYAKAMKQLLSYSEGALFLNDWESNVTSGRGQAFGLEGMLSKRIGKTTGWAAYGLSYADRQYEFINNGRPYPYKYDRRHDFKIAFSHRLQDWVEVSADWVISSGFAFSLPAEQYDLILPGSGEPPVTVIEYGQKNAYRMPIYHRLDLGVNFYFDTDQVRHTVNVGVYNLYNRKNPLYYDLRNRYVEEEGQVKLKKEFVPVSIIPMLPSLNYSLKF